MGKNESYLLAKHLILIIVENVLIMSRTILLHHVTFSNFHMDYQNCCSMSQKCLETCCCHKIELLIIVEKCLNYE